MTPSSFVPYKLSLNFRLFNSAKLFERVKNFSIFFFILLFETISFIWDKIFLVVLRNSSIYKICFIEILWLCIKE